MSKIIQEALNSPLDNEKVQSCIIDTRDHINKVISNGDKILSMAREQILRHDASKLEDPEFPIFVEVTPKLKELTYGSEEYKEQLKQMKVALDHHYEVNSHHPEHYPDGIKGMNLIDIMELICDWKAASERHADGDINKSLEINQKRFGYSDDLKMIMKNTIELMRK